MTILSLLAVRRKFLVLGIVLLAASWAANLRADEDHARPLAGQAQLFGTDSEGRLFRIDDNTGKSSELANPVVRFWRGLTYDPTTQSLLAWGEMPIGFGLLQIDPQTHQLTNWYDTGYVMFPNGYGYPLGLAAHPKTGDLWTMSWDASGHYYLAKVSGVGFTVGPRLIMPEVPHGWMFGPGTPMSLSFHPHNGILYVGFSNGSDPAAVGTVDIDTGVMTFVCGTWPGATGISFAQNGHVLYVLGANDSGLTCRVYTLDIRTGIGSWLGGSLDSAFTPANAGLAFVPGND